MRRSRLDTSRADDPIWSLVSLADDERFSGELVVGVEERLHLYLVDGIAYYAERATDRPLEERLVNCGAVTPAQLEAGGVWIGEHRSLARLFQRQPTIDRDEVELTIGTATEHLLETVASRPVGSVEVYPLRHHPAGIHHWRRDGARPGAPEVEHRATAHVEEPAVDESSVAPQPPVTPEPEVAPIVVDEPAPAAAPVEPTVSVTPEIVLPVLGAVAAEVPSPPMPTVEPVVEPVVEEPAPSLPTLAALGTVVAAEPVSADEHVPEPAPVTEPLPALPSLSALPSLTPLAATPAPAPEPEPTPEPIPASTPPAVAAATPIDTAPAVAVGDLPPLAPLTLGAFAPAAAPAVESLTPLSAFTTLAAPGTGTASPEREVLDPTPAEGVDASDIWRVVDELMEHRGDERA